MFDKNVPKIRLREAHVVLIRLVSSLEANNASTMQNRTRAYQMILEHKGYKTSENIYQLSKISIHLVFKIAQWINALSEVVRFEAAHVGTFVVVIEMPSPIAPWFSTK